MRERKEFSEEEIIRLLKYKTGALIRLSVEAGAISGGASQQQLEALGTFGEMVGVAFQIIDDVLNVHGDVKEYGKEIGGDIREGKKTVLAAHALREASPSDRKEFANLLGKKGITQSGIRKAIAIYEKYRSIEYAENEAKEYLNRSLKALDALSPSDAKMNLATIAEFLVSRSF
jgi:geranylgeranyl pyrophosphate synthase